LHNRDFGDKEDTLSKTVAKTPCGRQPELKTLNHQSHQNFACRFFWIKFKPSNKILVQGG